MWLAVVSREAHTNVHVRKTGYAQTENWLRTNCQNAHSSPTWQNNKRNPAAMYRSSGYTPLPF